MAARTLARLLASARDLLRAQAGEWRRGLGARASAAWRVRPPARRAGAVLAAALLGGAGVLSLAAGAGLPGRLPAPIDWRAASALLLRDGRPGDAVAVSPPWLERARELVPAGMPVVALPGPGDEPLPGVRRVWLLAAPSAPGAGGAAAAGLVRRAARHDRRRLGGLEVTRFDLAAPTLPVAVLAEGAPEAATREVDGAPRRCLVLRPTPAVPLVRPFPAVPLGRSLAGHTALLPGQGDAPVRVAFQVEGEEVGAVEVRAAAGWAPFQLDTVRFTRGTHPLTVVVTAAGDGARPICLEALALP
jgi:hypothetical protein